MHPPTELLTIPLAARHLNLSTTSATRLVEAGVAGPTYRVAGRTHGEALLIPTTQVTALQQAPTLEQHPEALVVRCGARQEDTSDDPRRFFGYDPDASWDDQAAGLGRWWPVKNPHHWTDRPFTATVAGFFVFAARITGHVQKERVAFTLERDTGLEEVFLGSRIAATRGGLIQILPDTTTAST